MPFGIYQTLSGKTAKDIPAGQTDSHATYGSMPFASTRKILKSVVNKWLSYPKYSKAQRVLVWLERHSIEPELPLDIHPGVNSGDFELNNVEMERWKHPLVSLLEAGTETCCQYIITFWVNLQLAHNEADMKIGNGCGFTYLSSAKVHANRNETRK